MLKIDKKLINSTKKADKINKNRLGNKCAYCGVYANTRDHVVPISFFSSGRPYTYKSHYANNNIVRACSECNSIGSDIMFENFWDKKKYICEMVEWKYKDILQSPDWNIKEINQLAGTLKLYVKDSLIVRDFIRIRVENLRSPEICE